MEADAIVGEERITCGMLHGIPIELETTRKQRNDKTQQHKPQQNNQRNTHIHTNTTAITYRFEPRQRFFVVLMCS